MTTRGPWEGAQTTPLSGGPYPAGDPYAAGDRPYADDPYQYNQPWRDAGPGRAPKPRRRRRWLRRILAFALAMFLLGGVVFTALMLMTPSVSTAPVLAESIDYAHHVPYPGPPVPPRFAAALTATEDHRFYSEPGVDPFAVARAAKAAVTGTPDQGGATLYQQLAKMLYTPGQSGVAVEVKQVILGIKLNFSYSKAQILQMYADVAYFGHGYYGLAAASCGYFGKQPIELSWPQAAMLAGLVQAPSAYNPIAHYAMGRSRQSHVLDRLVATGQLTQAQADRAFHQPLHLVGGPANACR